MKIGKKIFILLLAIMLTALPIEQKQNNIYAIENTYPPEAPTDLKTEMLTQAYGIDTKNPSFSWVVNDKDANESQTAYRIVISNTSELKGDVVDTGWVQSKDNTYVHACENVKLDDNELYYWQVQTKDKKGFQSPMSNPACFMTDVASQWQSLDGIWAKPEEKVWSDYTVEQQMRVVEGGALAVLVRMSPASKTGYMIQIRTNDNTIPIHKVVNGNIESAFTTINLESKGIVLPKDGSKFGLKIQVQGSTIHVWIDTDGEDQQSEYLDAGTVNIQNQGNFLTGNIGYRTGNSESGYIDKVKVTSTNSDILYENNFTSDDGRFNDLGIEDQSLNVTKKSFSVYSEGSVGLANFSMIRSPKLINKNDKKIDKVIISSACRGTGTDRAIIYDLYFNGQCIGAGSARELKGVGSYGGTSNYRQVFYNSYDVTSIFDTESANVISAVGNSRDSARAILIQMTIFYQDGTKEIMTNSSTSNSKWKSLDCTKAFGDEGTTIPAEGYINILHENIDYEYYPQGWNEVDFDDTNWKDAETNFTLADAKSYDLLSDKNAGRSALYPYSSENCLRVVTNEETKKIYRNQAGNLVVDLGKEIVGGIKININSSRKQKVTIHMGEEIGQDEIVKNQLTAGPKYEDKWRLMEGLNKFETVTMRNFRYIEFIGLDETTINNMLQDPDCVSGWAMQQKFSESDSDFVALGAGEKEKLLNRLWSLSKYTIKATNQDVFVDSQARERAPYEGDLLVNSNTSYAVSSNYTLARHSNEWLMDNQTWPNDYRLFSVEMAYQDYMYTGNKDSLSQYYNALKKKLVAEIDTEDTNTGMIHGKKTQAGNSALIDWPVSERDGYQEGYYDVILNSEYAGIYSIMAEISKALGQSQDVTIYNQKAQKLKNTLIEKAYDKESGCFYDSLNQDYTPVTHHSTHASAYALAYGIFNSQKMTDEMSKYVYENCKNEFKGSVYFSYFVLKGLYNGNHGDYAEEIMSNPKTGEDVKTFAALLDSLNCTITPEAWGHKWKKNMTLSHPWGASPGCSIVQGMFGISPLEAGFSKFQIKIQPGNIESASIKTPSVKGEIKVLFKDGNNEGISNKKMSAAVTIPVNTTAKVWLPVATYSNGYLMVDGVKTKATKNGEYLIVDVQSGNHVIVMTELGDDNNNITDNKTKYVLVKSVKISAISKKIAVGTKVKLQSTVLPKNAYNKQLKYSVSNKKYASINNKGQLVVKKAGIGKTVTITATTMDGSNVKAIYKVKILKNHVKKIKLSCKKKKIKAGTTTKIKSTVKTSGKNANTKLLWKSSKKAYATVNSKGKIKTKKAGKGKQVTIYAYSTDGTAKRAKVKIKIKK